MLEPNLVGIWRPPQQKTAAASALSTQLAQLSGCVGSRERSAELWDDCTHMGTACAQSPLSASQLLRLHWLDGKLRGCWNKMMGVVTEEQ